jgi:plasmid stabilization system protein ParE
VATLPYVIAYEAGSGVVTIVAVFHTSRDLARALPDRRGGLHEA